MFMPAGPISNWTPFMVGLRAQLIRAQGIAAAVQSAREAVAVGRDARQVIIAGEVDLGGRSTVA